MRIEHQVTTSGQGNCRVQRHSATFKHGMISGMLLPPCLSLRVGKGRQPRDNFPHITSLNESQGITVQLLLLGFPWIILPVIILCHIRYPGLQSKRHLITSNYKLQSFLKQSTQELGKLQSTFRSALAAVSLLVVQIIAGATDCPPCYNNTKCECEKSDNPKDSLYCYQRSSSRDHHRPPRCKEIATI